MVLTINETWDQGMNVLYSTSFTQTITDEAIVLVPDQPQIVLNATASIGPRGEPGIHVGTEPPANPYENQLWIKI